MARVNLLNADSVLSFDHAGTGELRSSCDDYNIYDHVCNVTGNASSLFYCRVSLKFENHTASAVRSLIRASYDYLRSRLGVDNRVSPNGDGF